MQSQTSARNLLTPPGRPEPFAFPEAHPIAPDPLCPDSGSSPTRRPASRLATATVQRHGSTNRTCLSRPLAALPPLSASPRAPGMPLSRMHGFVGGPYGTSIATMFRPRIAWQQVPHRSLTTGPQHSIQDCRRFMKFLFSTRVASSSEQMPAVATTQCEKARNDQIWPGQLDTSGLSHHHPASPGHRPFVLPHKVAAPRSPNSPEIRTHSLAPTRCWHRLSTPHPICHETCHNWHGARNLLITSLHPHPQPHKSAK